MGETTEIWQTYAIWTGWTVLYTILVVVGVLVAVAYYTYAERKVMGRDAASPRAKPCWSVWFACRPIADGLKLFSQRNDYSIGCEPRCVFAGADDAFCSVAYCVGGDSV